MKKVKESETSTLFPKMRHLLRKLCHPHLFGFLLLTQPRENQATNDRTSLYFVILNIPKLKKNVDSVPEVKCLMSNPARNVCMFENAMI